jgi:hemoglobin
MERPSLYDYAGGMPALFRLAAAHHRRCLDDPELNHPFSHPDQHPDHVSRLALYWGEVLGGPAEFTRTCGTHWAVLRLHAGTNAPSEMGQRFLQCFVAAQDDAGLPDDPEFRAALRAYMTWAVGDVMSYAPGGSIVPGRRAVPRWSWDGLETDGT